MLGWVQDIPLHIHTLQFLKFKQTYVKMEDRYKWNHFNQFIPFEVQAISQPLKTNQNNLFGAATKNIYSEVFLQIIIKTSVIPSFRHIHLNNFQMDAFAYENCSLRRILFQTLKQHSDYKSLIAKVFDGNPLKMKATSVFQVINNKRQCFQLHFDRTYILVLSVHFFTCPISRAILRTRKFGNLQRNLSTPALDFNSSGDYGTKHFLKQ